MVRDTNMKTNNTTKKITATNALWKKEKVLFKVCFRPVCILTKFCLDR